MKIAETEVDNLGAKEKRKAFLLLYEEHRVAMLYYAAKQVPLDLAEDLVHDVFTQAWNNRDNIHFDKQFGGYLFKALRHHILDYISKNANAHKYLEALRIFAVTFSSEEADNQIREKMFMEGIECLLSHFNPQNVSIFKLRVAGYTNVEIAEKLGVSEKTVRNQYSIMLKYLREKLPIIFLFMLKL